MIAKLIRRYFCQVDAHDFSRKVVVAHRDKGTTITGPHQVGAQQIHHHQEEQRDIEEAEIIIDFIAKHIDRIGCRP